MRLDYWESVKNIDVENLVFLDETGILLGLTRTHARSQQGTRAYAFTPFYRGTKVTAICAISSKKVVALMTMDNSMDSRAFELFVKDFLVPELWSSAVVVMDNLSSHKFVPHNIRKCCKSIVLEPKKYWNGTVARRKSLLL